MENSVIWQKPVQKSVWYAEWMLLWSCLADAVILGALLETMIWRHLSPTLYVGSILVSLMIIWQAQYTTASPRILISDRLSSEIVNKLDSQNLPIEDKHVTNFTHHLRAFFVTDCLLFTIATCALFLVTPNGWVHTAIIPAALLLMLPITQGVYYSYTYFKQAESLVNHIISE